MNFLPDEIKDNIPKLYETEDIKDLTVHVKLFTPDSNWTWYITEVSIDLDTCFGYVVSPFGSELGYFSLEEISQVRGNLGLKVERDLSFTPTNLSKIRKQSNVG